LPVVKVIKQIAVIDETRAKVIGQKATSLVSL